MPKLDRLKEEVAYLKFWQGVVVITDVSLLGWLISAVDQADRLRILLAAFGVILLTSLAVGLHREINTHMADIGKL